MKLVVSPAALADIERLQTFLVPNSPVAASRAAKALIDAVQSLAGRPSGTPNMRELIVPFGRTAYVLRYSYSAEPDELVVHRIWHGREIREQPGSGSTGPLFLAQP
ncbi:MAG: type II toxin-antitoxin system RelE/ParE family toxin [Xanthobacteraceae bacterium]